MVKLASHSVTLLSLQSSPPLGSVTMTQSAQESQIADEALSPYKAYQSFTHKAPLGAQVQVSSENSTVHMHQQERSQGGGRQNCQQSITQWLQEGRVQHSLVPDII